MQHSSKHGPEGIHGSREDAPGVEPDGRAPMLRTGRHGEDVGAPLTFQLRPVRRPAAAGAPGRADVAAEHAAEEDGVEVAKGFDDQIRTPRVALGVVQGGGEAPDGVPLVGRGSSCSVVVLDEFPVRAAGADKGSLVVTGEFEGGVDVPLAAWVPRSPVSVDVVRGLLDELLSVSVGHLLR